MGWFDTNGYILLLLVAGELGLPSLPVVVNGLPSEFGVCADTNELVVDEVELLVLCEDSCELINGWNWAYLGSILSIMNLDDIVT